jgi:hypothetical protein
LLADSVGCSSGWWYLWQRGRQEAARQLQRQDAEAAKQALREAIDLVDLRRQAQEAGLDPDEVIAGYKTLRDSQVSPENVLEWLRRAAITG